MITEYTDAAIVVPTLNEDLLIGSFLDSIYNQVLSPREIIVVDGGSQDNTPHIVQQWKKKFDRRNIRLLWKEINTRGITQARDVGFRLASSKIIFSCDADTYYPPNYIREATTWLKQARKGGFVAVVGNPESVQEPVWFIKIERKIQSIRDWLFAKIGSIVYLRAYNVAFIREAYLNSKGLRAWIYSVEDELGLSRVLRSQGKIGICWSMKPQSSNRRSKMGFLKFIWFLISDYWGAYYISLITGKKIVYKRVN